MALLKLVDKLINERGSAAIMEKRLLLVKEEAAALDKKNAQLAQEVERLTRENADLKARLPTQAESGEFVEFEGAAFKLKADGAFHHAIYCPIHHVAGCSPDPACPFSCPVKECAWVTYVTPNTLAKAVNRATPGTLSNTLARL
jgi:hypothetical protein